MNGGGSLGVQLHIKEICSAYAGLCLRVNPEKSKQKCEQSRVYSEISFIYSQKAPSMSK